MLIVADIRLYREGLAHVLAGDPRLAVVGAAADGDSALGLIGTLTPTVVLIDMAMPRSIALVRAIGAAWPTVKTVALGVNETEQDVLACAEAGVAGYVPRGASAEDLVTTLEGMRRGELLCSPRTVAALWRRICDLASGPSRRDGPEAALTPREREIGALLEVGLTNKDIAVRLGIEVTTVKNHVHNLLEKLHVHRRAHAAARLHGVSLRPAPVPSGRRATPVP